MKFLSARLKKVASDASPFKGKVELPSDRRVHWVKPQLVAEIEFAGWTEGVTFGKRRSKACVRISPRRK